jgi:chromosome segregation ATPase
LATAHEETEAEWAEAIALTKRMDEHVQRAAHAEAKVSELSQRIHELESPPDLTPALEEVRAAIDAARNDLRDRDAQFAATLNELVAVRTSLQSANARAEALEADVAKLRSEKEALESGVTQASNLAGHEGRAEQAAARAEELAIAVERAEARAEELAVELERAEARTREAEERGIELSSRVEEADVRTSELAARADRAEGLVTELAARAESAEIRADEMTARTEAAESHEEASPELEAASAEAEDLIAKLSAMTARLDAVRTDDGSASHDVASVQQELANVRRELDEALASADSSPTGDTESETATAPG